MSEKKKSSSSSSRRRSSGSSDPKHRRKEGAYTVAIRNESLNLTYRRLALAAVFSIIAAMVSVFAYLAVSGKPVPPQYVPVTEDGRLIPLVPLNKESVDAGTIGAFALRAVREVNNYDYLGWRTQVLEGQPYFTPNGWKAYMAQFEGTNIINTVEARKMIVVARPSGNYEIENKGVTDKGVFLWRVAVPIEINYVSHGETNKPVESLSSKGRVTLYIRRVPPTLAPQGIAIEAYQYEQIF